MNPTPLRNAVDRDEASAASPLVPVVTYALRVLGGRALLWVVTLGAGAMWWHATTHPEPLRIVSAGLYSLTVVLPFLWRDRQEG